MVEKTGYPKDMLDLDLDLEADLGVDTVKQAEMFAAIREIYNIPRDENRKLRDYPTLAHVIRFVYENRPDLAGASPTAPANVEAAATVAPAVSVQLATDDAIKEKVLEIVAEKTGYPKDMLDLDLDLEADLGVDTVKQAEMFASVRAAYNIPREENLKLRDFPTLAHVIQFARDKQNFSGNSRCTCSRGGRGIFGCDAGCTSSSALGQLRCGESNSTPRPGSQPAAAAEHLQANRCDLGPRQPCGGHAGQRRRGRSTDTTVAGDGRRSPFARLRAGRERVD